MPLNHEHPSRAPLVVRSVTLLLIKHIYRLSAESFQEMMLDPPAATGGNAGQSAQQAEMPMVADQTSPPRKLLRHQVGGSGQDLSAVQAGGNPVAQSPDMAEETVVERVTRRSSSKYSQPQATELKHEIFELTQALQNTRFLAAEEISHFSHPLRRLRAHLRSRGT